MMSSVAGPVGLSTLQREFARAYVTNGGNGIAAAREAGYSLASAHRSVTKCLASPIVIAEIKRLSIVNLSAKLPSLIAHLLDMADNPATDDRARVQAITALMDRAGATPQRGANLAVQVNVATTSSGSNLIAEIWRDKQACERAKVSEPQLVSNQPAEHELHARSAPLTAADPRQR